MSLKKNSHITDSAKILFDRHPIPFLSGEETTIVDLVGIALGLLGLFLYISYVHICSSRNV